MSLISRWWVPAEDVETGKRADEDLARLDLDAFNAGRISAVEYERRKAIRAVNAAETYRDQVDQAFVDGWNDAREEIQATAKDSVSAIAKAAGDVVGAPAAGILAGLPWWVWLGGGVAGLAYLGLLPGVLAGLRKAFKK